MHVRKNARKKNALLHTKVHKVIINPNKRDLLSII